MSTSGRGGVTPRTPAGGAGSAAGPSPPPRPPGGGRARPPAPPRVLGEANPWAAPRGRGGCPPRHRRCESVVRGRPLLPARPAEEGPAVTARPVVMSVDDDPSVSRAVARDLRRHLGGDYRVVRAESGPDALEALR